MSLNTRNPSVNSRITCSQLALQTQGLDARKTDYRVNWGDSGGTVVVDPSKCSVLRCSSNRVAALLRRDDVLPNGCISGDSQVPRFAAGNGSSPGDPRPSY